MTGGILVSINDRNGFIKMWSFFGANISVHVNAVDDVLKRLSLLIENNNNHA